MAAHFGRLGTIVNPWAAFGLGVLVPIFPVVLLFGLCFIIDLRTERPEDKYWQRLEDAFWYEKMKPPRGKYVRVGYVRVHSPGMAARN